MCRSGSPVDLTDLEIASPHAARSIIVLPPRARTPTRDVIKTVLAITNNPNRREEPYHIVTAGRPTPGAPTSCEMIGARDTVLPVLAADLIARVAAQTSRQSGLSVVYTELLDFGGDEIYFSEEPALVGRTYGDALIAYEACSVIGLRRADGDRDAEPAQGHAHRWPATASSPIAEDDDTVVLSGDAHCRSRRDRSANDRIASAADRREGPHPRLERLAARPSCASSTTTSRPGSHVTVVADSDGVEDAIARTGGAARQPVACG